MLLLIIATKDNWLFSMNSSRQTIYVLTWRRILGPTSEDRCQHTHRCQNTVARCILKEIRTRHLDVVPKSSTSLANSKY